MGSPFAADAEFSVWFSDRHTDDSWRMQSPFWDLEYGYEKGEPSQAALEIDIERSGCPDRIPQEGRHELIVVDESNGDEVWVGPITLIDDEEDQLVIEARDPSWFPAFVRRWTRDVTRFNVDAALLLAEIFAEADRTGDPHGLEIITAPIGIASDQIATTRQSTDVMFELQAAIASYTVVGRFAYLGDHTLPLPEVTLLSEHWKEDVPTVQTDLERTATDVTVFGVNGVVGWFPPNPDPSEAIARVGAVLSRTLESRAVTTERQAIALASATYRSQQSPLGVVSGRSAEISSLWPVAREDTRPGLTVRADSLGCCMEPADAELVVERCEFEVVNGIEESAGIRVTGSQLTG